MDHTIPVTSYDERPYEDLNEYHSKHFLHSKHAEMPEAHKTCSIKKKYEGQNAYEPMETRFAYNISNDKKFINNYREGASSKQGYSDKNIISVDSKCYNDSTFINLRTGQNCEQALQPAEMYHKEYGYYGKHVVPHNTAIENMQTRQQEICNKPEIRMKNASHSCLLPNVNYSMKTNFNNPLPTHTTHVHNTGLSLTNNSILSKLNNPCNKIASSSTPANLNQLHLNPPNFKNINMSTFNSGYYKNAQAISPDQFSRMRAKYNYVADLQLKTANNEHREMSHYDNFTSYSNILPSGSQPILPPNCNLSKNEKNVTKLRDHRQSQPVPDKMFAGKNDTFSRFHSNEVNSDLTALQSTFDGVKWSSEAKSATGFNYTLNQGRSNPDSFQNEADNKLINQQRIPMETEWGEDQRCSKLEIPYNFITPPRTYINCHEYEVIKKRKKTDNTSFGRVLPNQINTETTPGIYNHSKCNNQNRILQTPGVDTISPSSYENNEVQLIKKVNELEYDKKITDNEVRLRHVGKSQTFLPNQSSVNLNTKPNYKEMINYVHSLRNSTSENDLNMRIIKRTLNYDTTNLKQSENDLRKNIFDSPEANKVAPIPTQNVTSYDLTTLSHSGSSIVKKDPKNNVNVNMLSNHTRSRPNHLNEPPMAPKSETYVNVDNGNSTNQSNGAPLDLSVKTVKTSADSTDCKQKAQVYCSKLPFAVPKVDFMPNFAKHQLLGSRLSPTFSPTNDFNSNEHFNKIALKSKMLPIPGKAVASPDINYLENRLDVSNKFYENNNLKKCKPNEKFGTTHSDYVVNIVNENFEINVEKHEKIDDVFSSTLLNGTRKRTLPFSKNCDPVLEKQGRFEESSKQLSLQVSETMITQKSQMLDGITHSFLPTPVNKSIPGPDFPIDSLSAINKDCEHSSNIERSNSVSVISYAPDRTLSKKIKIEASDDCPIESIEPSTSSNIYFEKTCSANTTVNSHVLSIRIRTKAELKGFTSKSELTSIEELDKSFLVDKSPVQRNTPFDLLNWKSACNEFVEQLMGNNKKYRAKETNKLIKSRDSGLKSCILKTREEHNINKEHANISSEEDKPLLLLRQNITSAEHEQKIQKSGDCDSTKHKFNQYRQQRCKNRFEQERRFVARYSKNSSSDSDNEMEQTTKKRSRKYFRKNRIEKETVNSEGEDNAPGVLKRAPKRSTQGQHCIISPNASIRLSENDCILKTNKLLDNGSDIKSNVFINKIPISNSKCTKKKNVTDIKNSVAFDNTMTRSKRKRELEMQIANSKVLRNDKIIQNSVIERMSKRKLIKSNVECKDIITESIQTRLRKRKIKISNFALQNKLKGKKKDMNKAQYCKKKTVKNKMDKGKEFLNSKNYPPGWELEVYQYKKSLKVPLSLITVKGPINQRVSTSLPDLDAHSSDASEFCLPPQSECSEVLDEVKGPANKMIQAGKNEPKSIIDVLHSRIINSQDKRCSNVRRHIPKVKMICTNTYTNDEVELKPRNEHHNVFDTKILQSRTRTEYKMLKNREVIREVFGCDDRPASAPPDIIQVKTECSTFENQYEEYVRKMLMDIEKRDLERNQSTSANVKVDLRNNEDLNTVPEILLPSYKKNNTDKSIPSTYIKKLFKSRHTRRKLSSGFDYIRKKKKPVTNINKVYIEALKRRKQNLAELQNKRDEQDVSKEIQKWVLNKSVGQSAMHKAARLGYIDVIAYCLERMRLNPDLKDNAGYTPLHEACAKGRLDIARCLLQYGANHSESAHSGIRPLHEASENGHTEIVRLLLSFGADPLLTTYSGQTPLMLADDNQVQQFIQKYLFEVQNLGPHKQPWHFPGPWSIHDSDRCGYNILSEPPFAENTVDTLNTSLKEHSNNLIPSSNSEVVLFRKKNNVPSIFMANNCTVVLDNIDHFNTVKTYTDYHRRKTSQDGEIDHQFLVDGSDGEGCMFEFEEADMPLPPLYLFKDEGADKWMLLSDLCSLLKVKSKDTLLKQICALSPNSTINKELMRELQISEFLEKATCLQLLCSGEKINIGATKVVLVKYDESVRNLLRVNTILMKF